MILFDKNFDDQSAAMFEYRYIEPAFGRICAVQVNRTRIALDREIFEVYRVRIVERCVNKIKIT